MHCAINGIVRQKVVSEMRFIFSYLKKYIKVMTIGLGIKLLASIGELLIPYVLEHIIDYDIVILAVVDHL